jgi:hypothetical protein
MPNGDDYMGSITAGEIEVGVLERRVVALERKVTGLQGQVNALHGLSDALDVRIGRYDEIFEIVRALKKAMIIFPPEIVKEVGTEGDDTT